MVNQMRTLPEYYDQKLTILKQPIYNFGQNILDKSTKLINIGFSMEYFTAEFLQFWRTAVKMFLLGSRLVTLLSIPSISEISLKLSNFLSS